MVTEHRATNSEIRPHTFRGISYWERRLLLDA